MNGHNNNDWSGDYLRDDGADWWHQLDLDKRRQAEELKGIYDRQQLDHQQAQMNAHPCHCPLCKGSIP